MSARATALQVLKSAGWRWARRALQVQTRVEWQDGRGAWRVECARALRPGRWYLLDVQLAAAPADPRWEACLGSGVEHLIFEGTRCKTYLYCEAPVRTISLAPRERAESMAALRVVRVPRALAVARVLQSMRRYLAARAAARWREIASKRRSGADSALFEAYRRMNADRSGVAPAAAPASRTGRAAPAGAPSALCIDQLAPKVDRDAGSYAAVQEMQLLRALGFEVGFEAEEGGDPGAALRVHGPRLQLVYITRHHVAGNWIDAVRRHAPQAKVVLNLADLHFLRQEREAALYPEMPRAELERARRAELEVIARVDQVLCYTDAEIEVLQAAGVPPERLSRCPWVAEVAERVPGFAAREGIAFLGGYAHPPNVDAVIHFALELLPRIRRRSRRLRFHVYGSSMPPEVRALQGPDVEVHGYVPDLASAYDACRVFVAPLRFGAGLKGKVVTALARGTPSVLSPVAAEGLFARSGAEAAVAETPAQWVERVLAYYDDPTLWRSTSHAAREFARRTFSFSEGRRLMARALVRAGVRLPER